MTEEERRGIERVGEIFGERRHVAWTVAHDYDCAVGEVLRIWRERRERREREAAAKADLNGPVTVSR